MRKFLRILSTAMASFSAGYDHSSQLVGTFTSALHASRFFLSDSARANQIASGGHMSSLEFTKAFWNLAENGVLSSLSNVSY